MKDSSTYNNKNIYRQGARSMERIKPSKKINLSIMDEKLSLLDADIEELYKKYLQGKKVRVRKEKSEQGLVSRINFLIDEERKIRNQIENNVINNDFCCKNRSVRELRAPEIDNISGSIRYNTLENIDDSPKTGNFKDNNIERESSRIRYSNNFNKKGKEEIYDQNYGNKKITEIIKKNGKNDITFSSFQNKAIENNNNNITMSSRSNVTNNVCIIINNPEKNEFEEDSNNKSFHFQDISFAKKESRSSSKKKKIKDNLNINDNSNENNNINININENKNYNINNITGINNRINYNKNINKDNNDKLNINNIEKYNQSEEIYNEIDNNNFNIKENIFNNINENNNNKYNEKYVNNSNQGEINKIDNYLINYNNSFNNNDNYNDNENKNKINDEINFIKLKLASKLIKEKLQTSISQTYEQKDEIILNNKKYSNSNDIPENNINNFKCSEFQEENLGNSIKKPSLEIKNNPDNIDNRNKSLRNVLNSKLKKLRNLEKEIQLKKHSLKQKKNSAEFKRKTKQGNILNTENNKNNYNKIKVFDKRSFSKPDNNIIKIKNKVLKTFNHDNITYKNASKSKMIHKNKKKNKENENNKYSNLSIDSDEIILNDNDINKIINPKINTKIKKKNITNNNGNQQNNKEKNSKNIENPQINENIYAQYDSNSNLIPNPNLTFNQSIAKKRQLLGLPLIVKEKINKKKELKEKEFQKNNDKIYMNKKVIKYDKKNEEKSRKKKKR